MVYLNGLKRKALQMNHNLPLKESPKPLHDIPKTQNIIIRWKSYNITVEKQHRHLSLQFQINFQACLSNKDVTAMWPWIYGFLTSPMGARLSLESVQCKWSTILPRISEFCTKRRASSLTTKVTFQLPMCRRLVLCSVIFIMTNTMRANVTWCDYSFPPH